MSHGGSKTVICSASKSAEHIHQYEYKIILSQIEAD